MRKRIVAKTGEYTKDGQQKANWTTIGVINNNANGEYILIDPAVNLAGVLVKQNILATEQGKQSRSNVMCSIFEDDNQGGQHQAQGAAQPQQGQPIQQASNADFNSDVPF